VRTLGDRDRLFEFVLVDEGQDLEPIHFDILKAVARHVTVCIDHKQQIYDHGTSQPEILRCLGPRESNFHLLSVFRCSPYIVELAARFIQDANERTAFIAQNRVPMTGTEPPLLYLSDDWEDERARLIEMVKMRQGEGEHIAILLPTNRQVFGFARGLTEAGLEVEVKQESRKKDAPFPPLDFTSEVPKLLTYHSAKGLTFESVLLPRLVPGSFNRSTIPETNLLFVGATRATRWVYLSTVQGKDLLNMKEMRGLESEGKLTIQTRQDRFLGGQPTIRRAHQAAQPRPAEEGIGDFL
jgi:superfamily I DNA/RNA helicase